MEVTQMTDNPIAIVTGARRGIGKGIALALAEIGYDIVVNHVSPPDELVSALKDEIEAFGVSCLAVQANISQKCDRDKLIILLEKLSIEWLILESFFNFLQKFVLI